MSAVRRIRGGRSATAATAIKLYCQSMHCDLREIAALSMSEMKKRAM